MPAGPALRLAAVATVSVTLYLTQGGRPRATRKNETQASLNIGRAHPAVT